MSWFCPRVWSMVQLMQAEEHQRFLSKNYLRDFPGDPVAKTVLPMQSPGFDPWLGTRSCMPQLRIHKPKQNPIYRSEDQRS